MSYSTKNLAFRTDLGKKRLAGEEVQELCFHYHRAGAVHVRHLMMTPVKVAAAQSTS